MQIHEITEGFFSNVARGFAQGVTGVDLSPPNTTDITTIQPAPVTGPAPTTQLTPDQNKPVQQTRTVVSLSQPGQDQPAKYYKVGNTWTNELGQKILDPKQTAYLDKLIPTHGAKELVPVVPAEPARSTSRRRLRSRS